MKITKELNAKIDRCFNGKKAEIRKRYQDVIDKKRAEIRAQYETALSAFKNDPSTPESLLEAMFTFMRYDVKRDDGLIPAIALALSARTSVPNDDDESVSLEEELKLLDREKEEFLIALSYAASDLNSIKEIFSKYNLIF